MPIGAGELGLVEGQRAKVAEYLPGQRLEWLAMLTAIAHERGYKQGWAVVNFKEKFGAWPPYGAHVEPIQPTPEVRSWVRSRLIAYAKGKARGSAA